MVASLGWSGAATAQIQPGSATTAPPDYIIDYDSIHHPAVARGGMVASQNMVASQIGADILRRGGNAVDAAVAVGFALAVTLPRAGNLGGGGFMLVHLAKEKRTVAIEYYGQAPAALRPDTLLGANGKLDPAKRYSRLSVGVPGTPLGLWEAHRKYGRLPWRRLVDPAIKLAKNGIRVSEDMHYVLNLQRENLANDPNVAAAFYRAGAIAPDAGSLLKQSDLAWSLRQLRDHGADAMYRGALGKRLIADVQANGGFLSESDLDAYRIREQEPLWGSYRGHRIAYMPPPSGGMFLAELMNILERFPMKDYGQNSADSLHVIAESLKLVFADRTRFAGGYPDYAPPAAGLASKTYAAERASSISLAHTLDPVTPGNPMDFESRDTTHYSVVDRDGNVVSNTYTLGSSFGAHVMAKGTGFFLNDALANFSWSRSGSPTDANAPAPRKRVVSTIAPIILFKGEMPLLVSGTPGGTRIFSSMAQLLVNVIDHGLNIAEATQRPRIFQGTADTALEFEPGFPPDMLTLLRKRGHKVEPALTMGSTQSILLDNGGLFGSADTRRPDSGVAGTD